MQGFSIIMAAQIYTLILSTYKRHLPTNLVVLGFIFLGVAVLDFAHTLSHGSMPQFIHTAYQEKSVYFWFFARLFSACGLVFICIYSWNKKFKRQYFAPLTIILIAFLAIFNWLVFYAPNVLPTLYQPNAKLSGLKLFSHLLLLFLFAFATLILLWRLRQPQKYNTSNFFTAAYLLFLSVAIATINPYSSQFYHLISHLYEIAAIYFLYRAVFTEVVLQPYELLKNSEQKLAATLEASPDLIFEMDGYGRFLSAYSKNPKNTYRIESQVVNKTLDQILQEPHQNVAIDCLNEARKNGISRNKIIGFNTLNNTEAWFELSASFLPAASIEEQRFIVIARDITTRRQETKKLELLSHAVEQNPSAIFILNCNLEIQFVNKTFTQLTGYSSDDVLGKTPGFLSPPSHLKALKKHIKKEIQLGKIWQGEIERKTKCGNHYISQVVIYPVRDQEKVISSYLVIESDITENKKVLAELQKVSNFDRLTGLPNNDRLLQLLEHSINHHQHVAILWINLDHFKDINDALGHHVGDLLLKEIADRLSNALRPQDILARPSGDNFVMLMPGATHNIAATQAQELLHSFNHPLHTANRPIVLSSTIGIALYPWDSNNPATLLAQAETAMHRMKKESRGNFCFFKVEMRQKTARKLVISMALKEAIDNQEMYLVYQPQIHLQSGKIIGVEALLRWKSPIWGNTAPSEFIPIAEESGDIIQIGHWVIHQALQQTKKWLEKKIPIPKVSVNISALQFEQEDFVLTTIQALQELQLNSEHLEFELTEAVAMQNPEHSAAHIAVLRTEGINVSIDDFGTGYSSLSYLKRFDISTIKIDRSFIKEIYRNEDDQAIVDAIINIAHNLGMKTIAEGVQTKEQLEYLRRKGCYGAQGFYFTAPLTADELERFLEERSYKGHFLLD